MDTQSLPDVISGPNATPDLIVLIVMLGLGLLLWSAGAKIAKLMCATSGLLAGAAAAVALTPQGSALTTVLIATAAGSLIGTLLGLLFFRLWVAISCAVVFAALAPAVVLLWQSHVGALPQITAAPEPATANPIDAATGTPETQPTDPDFKADHAWWRQTRRWYTQNQSSLHRAWANLERQPRWITGIATMVAALVGLAIGLIGPNAAAAAQSSVVGSFLMLVGAEHILYMSIDQPPDWWPQIPETRITTFAAVVVVGMAIQFVLTRRAKES